jgi:hypothetical protein
MIIFILAFLAVIVGIHRFVMSAVENYEYGSGGSYREWREFERQHGYGQ